MFNLIFLDEHYSNAITDLEEIIPITGNGVVESENKENLFISVLELEYSLI